MRVNPTLPSSKSFNKKRPKQHKEECRQDFQESLDKKKRELNEKNKK